MLTPVEIQSKVFKSGGLGYDKKDVDNFIREVLRSFEDIYRENMELKDKVAVLNDGIQYYKTIEKTLQKALVLAEKTAEETRLNAAKEAKTIEKEATIKANLMLADAKNELEALHQQTISLVQQYEKYKTQFKRLADAQIDLINSDAFQINVQKLDVFLTNPVSFDTPQKLEQPSSKSEEVNEIVNTKSANIGGHLSDMLASQSDEDFFDDNMEGQEEFDFLDLNED